MPDRRSHASQPLLEIEKLEVRYGGVPAVRGLDLSLSAGEAVGLIGPNGAGKSSSLMAIMGAVRPSSGSVKLRGEELVGLPPDAVVRRGLALVPEGRQVFVGLSVRDNLALGLAGRRSKQGVSEDLERVHDLFPILADFADRQAGQLSGGQQQQLAIARALVSAPDVLMLDEPSLGLSPAAVDTVFEALTTVRSTGVALLVVEQRAEYTVAFCDRTRVLHDGTVTLDLMPADAYDDSLLTKAYFGS